MLSMKIYSMFYRLRFIYHRWYRLSSFNTITVFIKVYHCNITSNIKISTNTMISASWKYKHVQREHGYMSEWLLYVKIGVLVILSDKITFFVTKTRQIPQKWGSKRQMKRIPLWQISTLYMLSGKVTQISNKLRWFYIQLDDKYKVELCISYRSNYFVPYLALKSGFGYIHYEYYPITEGLGLCIDLIRATVAVYVIENDVRSNRANDWGLDIKSTPYPYGYDRNTCLRGATCIALLLFPLHSQHSIISIDEFHKCGRS